MSDKKIPGNGSIFNSMIQNKREMMETGYREMGALNLSLSEEGLDQDIESLKSYEKYLVESE
jgi:hypothetical protein